MVMWTRALVLFVCVILFRVLAIERVAKPVVFSYSSADLPHPATISHHYNGPVSSSVEQQFTPARLKYRIKNESGQEDFHPDSGSYQLTPAYSEGRASENHQPHAIANSPSYAQEEYDYVTVNPNEHYMATTLAYYDERSVDGNQYYHSPSGRKSVRNHQTSYVYPTARHSNNNHLNGMLSTSASSVHNDNHKDYEISTPPNNFQSAASYYDVPPGDNSRHDPNPTSTSIPSYENIKGGKKFAGINPDDSYHSTTVTYYRRLPTKSHGFPPSTPSLLYDDQNLDYDNDTNSFMPNEDQNRQYISEIHSPSPTTLQHDNTKVSMSSNKSVSNEFIPSHDSSVATTQGADSSALYPVQKTSYLGQPATHQLTEHGFPRTSRRRMYSSTTNYYEDSDELISTTPIAEFESVRKKLPPIDDYPPPNPGYITDTFKNRINNWRNSNSNIERVSDNDGSKKVSLGDKVLQQPKFFAYSSDLVNDQTGESERKGIDFHGEQPSPHKILLQDRHQNRDDYEHHDDHEYDDHDDGHHKRKEEKYSKGGGQEHHSAHKASGGDKGDKGYKSIHEHTSGKKGHHDKEDHKGKYVDEKGKKGKKKEEAGHYGEQHQAEKGKKAAKYGESGEHKKGHSTKGEHNIHKKDEYMKKHEFYDEHHEGGDHEKFGGFLAAHAHKNGAKKKKGHLKSSSSHHQRGKKGIYEKGKKEDHEKGHKDAKGIAGHFAHHKKYGKKGGHKEGRKWGYSKGHPK